MEKPRLEHWKFLDDTYLKQGKVSLSTHESYSPLTCQIYKRGIMKLETADLEGGFVHAEDMGREYHEWIRLLEEARRVFEYYFKS